MRVLFVTNLPSPYRVDFFNELGKACSLTVLYERKSSQERDSKWINKGERNFKEIFSDCKEKGKDKSTGKGLIDKIKQLEFDKLLISGYASPAVMLLITYCKFKKIEYYIETDGGFNNRDKLLKKLLKKFLLKKAKGVFVTCEDSVAYYKNLGCASVYKYPFSSIYTEEVKKEPATEKEKEKLKKELEINEENVVLSVGRFTYLRGYGKGYDCILRAATLLKEKNIGWYIVGGEPTDEFKILKEKNGLDNVHYVDFKEKEELKKYYRMADIFVLMTVKDVWGLVVNEAMAEGKSVITTDRCVAGLEMIENEENGYIIPVGDEKKLSEKVAFLLENKELRGKIEKNNLEKIKNWTIENMAKVHIEFLSKED